MHTKHIIAADNTLLDGLKKLCLLTEAETHTLFVINEEGRILGSVTDGDIRRYLVSGGILSEPISSAMNVNFIYAQNESDLLGRAETLRRKKAHLVPHLDENMRLIKLYDLLKIKTHIPVDAVLMAGGRGERLRPLTDETPKPLLPLGNKVVMEYNVDNIVSMGIANLTICIRYLGEQIVEYFGDGSSKGINIQYVKEEKPLGTLGAITLIPKFEHDVVLLMNSDLFTDINLEEFYLHFINSGADMSVATTSYDVSIPYAILGIENEQVVSMEEKPTHTYYSNAGIYLIKKSLLEALPKGERIDVTDLMISLIKRKGGLTHFPIAGYWLDIGSKKEYQKAQAFVQFSGQH